MARLANKMGGERGYNMTLEVWQYIRQEAKMLAEHEPMLASFFHSTILKHQNLGSALSYLLANKLANPIMPAISLREIIEEAYQANPSIIVSMLFRVIGLHIICGIRIEKRLRFICKIRFQ